ncbi:hypothetical protein RUND412_005257 [Rhizina undulata]
MANYISGELLTAPSPESVEARKSKMSGVPLKDFMYKVEKRAKDFTPFDNMPPSPIDNGTNGEGSWDNMIVDWAPYPSLDIPQSQAKDIDNGLQYTVGSAVSTTSTGARKRQKRNALQSSNSQDIEDPSIKDRGNREAPASVNSGRRRYLKRKAAVQ